MPIVESAGVPARPAAGAIARTPREVPGAVCCHRGIGLDRITPVPGFAVDDAELSLLHDRAFGHAGPVLPWAERLERYSLARIGAFDDGRLVGFVHACWDGGRHAFLLDTAVDPDSQHRGIGRALVMALVDEVRAAGCEWLHVDHEAHLRAFYEDVCGFRPTAAGLLHLAPENAA